MRWSARLTHRVTRLLASPGDRVAVLTEINGYAEYVYVRRNPILRIPELVDAAAAVTLVLNYLVAYQVLHRRSRVQAGDRVLIVGAGGGIGTALCELGQLAGLVMYGVDSAAKHHVLTRYGVIPIDLERTTWRRRSGGPNRTVSTR